ncbi:MAG: hypothetical protein NC311_12105 [Muribaculaceae bacterium]|nr:hypothetical protein [Muribaculaceae bacterium]
MEENHDYIVKKSAEDLENEKKQERKEKLGRLGVIAWLALGIGLLFGGMFSGINPLVYAGIGVLFGGALLASLIALGVWSFKSAIKNYKKHGGSKASYIMKAVVCIALILGALALGVCGFLISEGFIFGAIGAFFVFIVVFFGWRL